MTRVLIAGCGYLGQALGLRLIQEGHEVCGLRRKSEKLPSNFLQIRADLTLPETLVNLPWPIDVVYYMVGADHRNEESYHAAYVQGLVNLVRALENQNPVVRRWIFTSSTAVYHQSCGEWVDENSTVAPNHFSGRCLRKAENFLLSNVTEAIVVRLGGIYGPGRHRLIDHVRTSEIQKIEGPSRYLNHVHRDDCVGALVHLLSLNNPQALYLVVDNEPVDKNQLIDWIARQLGTDLPSKLKTTSQIMQQSNKRCRNTLIVNSGYSFRYPSFREGYAPLLFKELQ